MSRKIQYAECVNIPNCIVLQSQHSGWNFYKDQIEQKSDYLIAF